MAPGLLADILLIVHFLYVLAVVLPVPLIVLGGIFRWSWVANSWFRNIHLGMILILMVQAVFGWICPMTDWEVVLRIQAGEPVYGGSFVAHWVEELLYYDLSEETFNVIYLGFGLLVLFLYWFVPSRWLLRKKKAYREGS